MTEKNVEENQAKLGVRLRQAGLLLEPSDSGGITIVSPVLRQPTYAVVNLLTMIAALFLSIVLSRTDAPFYFPVMSFIVSIFMAVMSMDIWFGKWSAEISHNGVRLWHGPFGKGAIRHIPFSDIKTIDMQHSIQAGNTQYYSVVLVKHNGKKIRVINRLLHTDASILIEALRTAITDYGPKETAKITTGNRKFAEKRSATVKRTNIYEPRKVETLGEKEKQTGLHFTSREESDLVLEFPRMRHPEESQAFILVLGMMIGTYLICLIVGTAPIFSFKFVIFVAVIAYLVTIIAYYCLWESSVEIKYGKAFVRRGLLGIGLTRQVNLKDIESINKKITVGNYETEGKKYYTVFFKKHYGGILTIAVLLNYEEAQEAISALDTAMSKHRSGK